MASVLGPTEVDLSSVEQRERAGVWMRSAGIFFPGLCFTRPPVNPSLGSMQGIPFGLGCLWDVISPPLLLRYSPVVRATTPMLFLSVMLQVEGGMGVTQGGRECYLSPGEFCVIDGGSPWELEVTQAGSRVIFLQMPRDAVLSRKPGLEGCTARAFDRNDTGAQLLTGFLRNVADCAPYLDTSQRAAVLASLVQLLGAPKQAGHNEPRGRASERVTAALAFIDAELCDPALTAERVADAQGLSRRRLDHIMLGTLGAPLTAQIWQRRLRQAASDLLDPRYAEHTVTQIAFSVGFQDAAHFARAFKRRYHCTPSEWRKSPGRGLEHTAEQ